MFFIFLRLIPGSNNWVHGVDVYLIFRELQSKLTERYHSTPSKIGIIKKTNKVKTDKPEYQWAVSISSSVGLDSVLPPTDLGARSHAKDLSHTTVDRIPSNLLCANDSSNPGAGYNFPTLMNCITNDMCPYF